MYTFVIGLQFEPGEVITIGARPGMGKSCIGMQFAQEASAQGANVLIISFEQTADQIMKRILLQRSDHKKEDEKIDVVENSITICDFCDWRSRFENWEGFYKKAIEEEREKYMAYDLILIDYLQLINTCEPQTSRRIEIDLIVTGIKQMAMELKLTVILLSQLTRKVEERIGHRPIMTDLRESGTIEEVSDMVLLLMRRDFYDPMDKPGRAELILAKSRTGRPLDFPLIFRKELCIFANRNTRYDDGGFPEYDKDL